MVEKVRVVINDAAAIYYATIRAEGTSPSANAFLDEIRKVYTDLTGFFDRATWATYAAGSTPYYSPTATQVTAAPFAFDQQPLKIEPIEFNPQARVPFDVSLGRSPLLRRAVTEVRVQKEGDVQKSTDEFLAALLPESVTPVDFGAPLIPSSIFADIDGDYPA